VTVMAVVNPRLDRFVVRMRRKLALPQNQAKGDWRNESDLWLLSRLQAELSEMATALDLGDREGFADECADAANVLMMLADNSRPEGA